MAYITSRIAPLYFHYYLAGHDSPVVFEYIFKLLATEDRIMQFAEGDPNALLLLPHIKRDYAKAALSAIIDMVKLHAANPAHLECGGWGDCQAAQRLYVVVCHRTILHYVTCRCPNLDTEPSFRMIQRIVEAMNPAPAMHIAGMLSLRQIQKDINISMSILAVLIQCIEVPQVGPRLLCLALLSTFNAIVFQICVGLQCKQMFALLQPLIAPKDFKYNDGGAFRRRVIQLAVLLAMLGQSEKDFHPWHEIIEKNILVRLQQLHFDAQTFTRIVGDKPRHELLMEQKDLINGVMFALNREVLPSVAVSYFSNTRNLIALAASISRLNAFTQIPDFDDFRGEDCP